MTTDYFCADAWKKRHIRDRKWCQENLMPVLLEAKEQRIRDIDTTIGLAKQLLELYNEKVVNPAPAPVYKLKTFEDDSSMKPVEPEVLDLIYGSAEKGFGKRYLAERNKKSPEDKYNFRLSGNWEYGWLQRPRERAAHGRCALLRDTFYRRNNVAPDPEHYRPPAGVDFSICTQYSCH